MALGTSLTGIIHMQPDKVVRWCPDGNFFASFLTFLCPVFSSSRMQHVSDLHPKFALSPHHVWICGSMVDIQWTTYCCLTSFFPIVNMCLSCEHIARQNCAMVPRWRFMVTFLHPVFSASRMQQVSDLHSKFALRPHHVVDIW